MKVAVVGAGSWGTTMASLVATKAETALWGLEPEVVASVNTHHENRLFLPGCPLTPALTASSALGEVLDGAGLAILAVPSRYLRSVLAHVAPLVAPSVPVLSLTKGVEEGTLLRMTQVVADVLNGHDPNAIGVLSGPNIAREILSGDPAATVVAFPSIEVARSVQDLLSTALFRVYTNTDVVGCEVGGAFKNVIALAAGMATGLGYGANTLGALITRGLAELTRLGVALGGAPLTFIGLAGVGDLLTTCSSPQSRNRTVGVELARGRNLLQILGSMRAIAEGVETARPLLALASSKSIEVPIAEQVVAVLDGARGPGEALDLLMHRAPTDELHGIAAHA